MAGEPTLDLSKEWALVNESMFGGPGGPVGPINVNGIDLADSSALGGVNIPDNLPQGDGSGEKWHECVEVFPSELFSPSTAQSGGNPPPSTGALKEEDKWNFVMNKLISIESNTCNLTKNVSTLAGKVDVQAGVLKEVKSATALNEQKINDLYKKQEAIAAEVDQRVEARLRIVEASVQQENAAFKAQVLEEAKEQRQADSQEARDEFIQEQCESRKPNLLFVGLNEAEGEEPIKVISSFLKKCMGITGVRVDTAYRLGKPGGSKPRPILARFPFMAQRQRIWYSKSKIKPTEEGEKVWIHEDLPKKAKHVQRTFYRILKKAKSLGGRFEGAHIMGQSLYIDGKAYREENLEALPADLRPSSLATLQSENAVAFFGRFSPFSNHHPSPFTLNNRIFSCMEQFLAWSRASLAGDQTLISRPSK